MRGAAGTAGRRDSAVQRLAQASKVVCHALAGNRRAQLAKALVATENDWKTLAAEVPRTRTVAALASWRGSVDAVAARARYGDARLHAQRAPTGELARRLFDLLEQSRVEALASRDFPGMRYNLAALCHEKWSRAHPEGAIRGVGTGWIETFALLARVPLGAPFPEVAARAFETHWRSWMAPDVAAALESMRQVLDDPEQFARQSLQIVAAVIPAEDDRRAMLRSGASREQPEHNGAATAHTTRPTDDRSESSAARPAGQPTESAGEQHETRDAARARPPHDDRRYEVYTTQFDRISHAGELRDGATLERRRCELDRHAGEHLAGITRWAHRLQRRLLAMQLRSWQFDRDEGRLDAARLARVVTHPLEPLACKQESEIEFPDTVVGLLVDNSGSMRGAPIATAAACAEILGRVLERCGVKTEILGFTTRSWHGGHARRKWVADGCPPHPGRIADLQHVIYKSADEPWRRARPRLGLMLEGDLLKENIDGEALLWAADRLQRRMEPRRILIVISDGAPLDEATLAANGAEFLDRHLRAVIERIERFSPLELLAVGIGHDVTAYYRRAVTLDSAAQLGEALVTQLIDLLASPRRQSRQRPKWTQNIAREARGTPERQEGM